MKLKQFLKPDWRKVVMAIIIFNIMPLSILFWFCPLHALCMPSLPRLEFFGFLKCLLYLFNARREIFGEGSYRVDCYPPQFFISVIISYFLSCLIIWIYEKLKKRP